MSSGAFGALKATRCFPTISNAGGGAPSCYSGPSYYLLDRPESIGSLPLSIESPSPY